MLLDLSLEIFSGDGESPAGEHHDSGENPAVKAGNLLKDSRILSEEDSGASSSSSSTTGGFIRFGILQKDKTIPSPESSNFPGNSAAGEKGSPGSSSGQKWLNLSPWIDGNRSNGGDNKPERKGKRRRGPRSRSSPYRGVTFYRRTGRWESHIWDCGKQVYLGGFDTAHAAARAYDRAAIMFRGLDADINFGAGDYVEEMKQMKSLTKEEVVLVLRRQSNRDRTLYKCRKQWEAKPIQLVARDELRGISEIGYNNGFWTNRCGITLFGSSNDEEQNLELSLGISSSANRIERVESERDLTRNHLKMKAKHSPTLLVGIYPDIFVNYQRMFGKKIERGNGKDKIHRIGVMSNGMDADRSLRFSSSSAPDPSPSLLPLKACSTSILHGDTSNLPSTTRNAGSFTAKIEDLNLYL